MSSRLRDHTLPSGTVIQVIDVVLSGGRKQAVKPVSPVAWVPIFEMNPPPEEPKDISEHPHTGVVTKVTIPPDDPRFRQYVIDREQHEIDLSRLIQKVEWLAAFPDGLLGVLDDWEVPDAFRYAGVETAEDPVERKIQYIRYDLIRVPGDKALIDDAIQGNLEASKAAVEAAAGMFPGEPGDNSGQARETATVEAGS